MGDGQGGGATIEAATEIAARLQTYMLVRCGMSMLTGLSFWIFTAVYGFELQREWGVIAFVLNFIPFIGSFVATLLPTLFAAAQFESLYAALVLNLLQFVIGSSIEPRVAGSAVSVSPFMVLFAVFFWGMLWGVAGAFIGVPILIALATVAARHPVTRPIAVLLSADGAT
jgi:predicted PurR-regulated permease PerM